MKAGKGEREEGSQATEKAKGRELATWHFMPKAGTGFISSYEKVEKRRFAFLLSAQLLKLDGG